MHDLIRLEDAYKGTFSGVFFVCLFVYFCFFLICLCFLRSQSIALIIGKRYDDRILTNVRKFERLDYQIRKCKLDIKFFTTCHK